MHVRLGTATPYNLCLVLSEPYFSAHPAFCHTQLHPRTVACSQQLATPDQCAGCMCSASSAILPIPSAFAITGATAGTLFLAFVALTNVYTCNLLLRGAVTTGAVDYEGLSYAVGGYPLKVGTVASLCA